MGDILSNKYQNVGLNPEVLQRMKEGKSTPEDISIFKQVYGEAATAEMFPDFKFESK
jgi:cytochrome c-type biogenesis protein CcmH/NrfF